MNTAIRVIFTRLMVCLSMVCGSAHSQTAPSTSDIEHYEGLHQAAHQGDIDALQKLIKNGANVEAEDSSGRTPLIVAAFASHDEIVTALSAAGANLNALENRAYDIVTIAAVADDVPLLDLALELGANSGNITSPYDGTALIAAAHLGHSAVVNSLIQAKAPLDHINNLGWTALIEAVILGDGGPDHVETAKLLLEAGADPSIADSQGVTPLEHAKSRGFGDMVRLFK